MTCFTHQLIPIKLRNAFWQYARVFQNYSHSFLLDSAVENSHTGKFSFMGAQPFLTFKAWRPSTILGSSQARIEIDDQRTQQRPVVLQSDNPFLELQKLLRLYEIPTSRYQPSPFPFLSGAVGYVGYESVQFLEKLSEIKDDLVGLPDIYFMFFDSILCFDHQNKQTFLSIIGRGNTQVEADESVKKQQASILDALAQFEIDVFSEITHFKPIAHGHCDSQSVKERLDHQAYVATIQKVKSHLRRGDIYEACLSNQLEISINMTSAWDYYKILRHTSPAPFSSFLSFPEAKVVCSSPERFLKLSTDRIAESRPIKGTRRRGISNSEDLTLITDLDHSEKDRCEHVMIVDVVRNDLSKVCQPGSVHVPQLMKVEEYATVFQMVSSIQGILEPNLSALDLLLACFPGGSMTGAPKNSAIRILAELEPVARGIYSGALGYIDFSGSMDLAMIIRTAIITESGATIGVGGAIIEDSDPESEYLETQVKTRGLLLALENMASVK